MKVCWNVLRFKDVRQTELHIANPLDPEARAVEVQTAIEKLNS